MPTEDNHTNLSFSQMALRISDRFYDVQEQESIGRQIRLQNWIVLVSVVYGMMIIACVKLKELEDRHPITFHDMDVSFEIALPPAEPPQKPMELPRSVSLVPGINPNPGSETAPAPSHTAQVSMPAIKAPPISETHTMVPAQPVPSHKTTLAAPIAKTTTNEIKASPATVSQMKTAAPRTPAPLAGAASTQPASGESTEGGTPGTQEAGIGTGGAGTGGTGTDGGDAGAGAGTEDAGGREIATRLPASARVASGNIGPYRRNLLARIVQNWHPKNAVSLIVLVTLDHDGNLLSSEIFQSSGSKRADKEALAAVKATEYAPLPDWFKGDKLRFQIDLSQDVEETTQPPSSQ